MKRIDHHILLAAITLGGFALRVVRLDFQPLWWDEGYSLFFATRDFATMLERTAVDIHPPLYYALLQFWMALAGKSEVAVRLLSVAIGTAAIPLLYMLTIKLFANRRVALIAALLLALSPLHIYYSQEVRMYGLVTLLGLASVYLFVHLLEMPQGEPKTAIVALAYVLVTTAALYTQYYAAFILVFEILAVVICAIRLRWRIGSLAHWLIAFLAIAVLYLPWVIYAGGKLYAYITTKKAIEQYSPLDPITYLAQHLAAFSVGHLTDWTWLAWGSVVLVALALLGIASTRRQGDTEIRGNGDAPQVSLSPGLVVSLYLFVPLAFGYIVNLVYPFHPIRNERLLLLAMPAFLMLVALGVNSLGNHRASFGILALVITASLSAASLYDFYTVPRYPNDDYRPLIAEVQQLAQPGDIVLADYPWQIGYLEMYYAGAQLETVETPSDTWINNPVQMLNDLDALTTLHPRIWLPALQTQGHILEDMLNANLRLNNYSLIDTWFGTTRLELFQRAEDPPRVARSIQFTLGGGTFTLDNWGLSVDPVAAGQSIVRLWIDNRDLALSTFKASLRLVDANGNVWAQDDREITSGMQRIGFAVPVGTPPTHYDLRMEVYRDQEPASQSESLARVQVVAPAQPNLAAVPNRQMIYFGDGIRLIGYDVPQVVQPGNPTPITLFWQATRPPDGYYVVELRVPDERVHTLGGGTITMTQTSPALGIYPTPRWQSNDIIRDPQTITLPADTPDGEYRIEVGLGDTRDGHFLSGTNIGPITVKGRAHYFGAPAPAQALNARFGDIGRLVGYDLNSDGRNVRLVLYWQALASTMTSYKVFVHIVDSDGNIVTQGDQVPGVGTLPTTSWVKSEYLADLHEIVIPPNSQAAEYQIRIGLYDPATGVRLSVFDTSNRNSGDYIQLPTRITVP